MNSIILYSIFWRLTSIAIVFGQFYEGEDCSLSDNTLGVCKSLSKCDAVYQELLSGNIPKSICSYVDFEPIVCCRTLTSTNSGKTSFATRGTTRKLITTTQRSTSWFFTTKNQKRTTERESDSWIFEFPETSSPTYPDNTNQFNYNNHHYDNNNYNNNNNNNDNNNNNNNNDNNYNNNNQFQSRGNLARQKCSEYARSIYTLVTPPTLAGNRQPVNVSLCAIKSQKLIVGGTKAAPKEFPHMAAIGYNSNSGGEILWLCGGTLVSENFVLTAAHCTFSLDYGKATRVRVGDLNLKRSDDDARPQVRKIISIIRHPDYKKPLEYHDIALLKLESPVKFDAWVRPACLPYGMMNTENAIATGWGRVDWADEEGSEDLLKVTLAMVPHRTCNSNFMAGGNDYKLKQGVIDEWQLCAGEEGKDTCQGDSGGPLVNFNNEYSCMYNVIGITSLGRLCGSFIPGIYTRVSYYIPWLEQTIWQR
ncbi:serine protease snake [Microplitis demolitor]|uniref:serine protease snake n=1 Tax=Microplitis demolitor TaxID=69319 RepID=UPI0004CD9056|nr:serine protease snake [Microplitis demolitor]